MTAVRRILRSDSAFALAVILPTLAGVAAFGAIVYTVCTALKGLPS